MDQQEPSPNYYRVMLAIAVTMFAMVSFITTCLFADVLGQLVNFQPTIWLMLSLLTWRVGAGTARRIYVGKIEGLRFTGRSTIAFGLLRIGFLFSSVSLLAGWLIAAAVGSPLAAVFLRAAAFLMVISFAAGIVGGAIFNSCLVVRRWQKRESL